MSYYDYDKERSKIFTESGQVDFLKVRDHVNDLLNNSGAFKMGNAISVITGDAWTMMAHIDRLVEIGEIREISQFAVAGQDRVFVKNIR